MFWRKKRIEYEIINLPLKSTFHEMNEEEAEYYFGWFMEQIPKRIEYLSIQSGCILDYSEESLVGLWIWFLEIAEVERTPKKALSEIKRELQNKPKSFVNAVLEDSKEQLSLQTEYIMIDIGMYLGEMFVRNNEKLFWSFCSDDPEDVFFNIPGIRGFIMNDFSPPFKAFFEPIHMTRVQVSNIIDETQDSNDLLGIYKLWTEWVPNQYL